jgi:hypothetical protein
LKTVLVLPGIKKMKSVIATQSDELCRIANPNVDIFDEWRKSRESAQNMDELQAGL